MSALQLFTSTSSPNYTQRVALDGREYVLRIRWNQRAEKWFMNIADSDGVMIVSGLKLVLNVVVGGLFRGVDPRMPPGGFLLVDNTDQERDPGLTELGLRVFLVYIEAVDE